MISEKRRIHVNPLRSQLVPGLATSGEAVVLVACNVAVLGSTTLGSIGRRDIFGGGLGHGDDIPNGGVLALGGDLSSGRGRGSRGLGHDGVLNKDRRAGDLSRKSARYRGRSRSRSLLGGARKRRWGGRRVAATLTAAITTTGTFAARGAATKSPAREREAVRKSIKFLSDGGSQVVERLNDLGGDGAVIVGAKATRNGRASVHTPGTGIASVDDGLQGVGVPAGDEVGVGAEASHVAIGEDERLSLAVLGPLVVELGSVPVDLKEEMRNVDVTLGAVLETIAGILGPRHVVLVVVKTSLGVVARGKVKVLAKRRGVAVALLGRETNAGTLVLRVLDTSSAAVRVGRVGWDVVVAGRAGELDVVEARLVRVELDTRASRGGALVGVTNQDLEARGKGNEIIVGLLKEVVHVHVEHLDLLVLAILREEQLRNPVIAEVLGDLGSGASGLVKQLVALDIESKGIATLDHVVVLRGSTGVDDRVHTALCQRCLTIEAENSEGSLVVSSRGRSHKGAEDGGGLHDARLLVGVSWSRRSIAK